MDSQPPLPPAPLPQGATLNPYLSKITTALKAMKSPEGIKLLGFQAVAIAVIGIVMAVCYLVPLNNMADSGSSLTGSFDLGAQLHSFKTFILLIGAALGGGLHLTGAGYEDGAMLSLKATFSLVSITSIVAIASVNYLVVRKLSGAVRAKSWKQAALTSGLNALALSLIFLLITLFGKLSFVPDEDFSFDLAPRSASLFFTLLIVLFFTQFLASTPQRVGGAPSWASGLRESIVALLLILTVFAVIAVITYLVMLDGDNPGGAILLILPVLGTLGVYGTALGFFGSLAPTMSGASNMLTEEFGSTLPTSTLKLTDMAQGKGAWIFVVTVLLILLLALYIGVRRPRLATGFNSNRVWQLPVFSLVLWMILAWLTELSLQGGFSAPIMGALKGNISYGITWYSVVFVALGMALVSVLAEFLPLQVYRFAPGLLAFIGGKQTTARWVSGTAAPVAASTVAVPTVPTPTVISAAPTVPAEAQTIRTEAVAAQPAQALAPASAESKKRAKAIGFSAVGLVVLVALSVGAVAYLNSQRKPEAQVQQYLELLAAGKGSEATKMVDPGVDNATRVLLDDKTMAKALTRLTVNDVSVEQKNDHSALVSASYSINGERQQHDFTVDRGDKEFGLLDTWVLNDPLLVQVQLATDSVPAVTVGETKVPLEDNEDFYDESSSYSSTLYAYPGIYQVTAPTSDYLTVAPQELRVNSTTDAQTPSVSLTTTGTDALNKLVLDEVKKFSTACVTPPTNMIDSCPYELQGKDLASFSVKSPADSVELDGLTSFRSSEVTFKYKRNNTEYMDYDQEETSKSFSGTIIWESDKPQVEITDSSWW